MDTAFLQHEREFVMALREFEAKIGQDLLNKLGDSLSQGKWRPHKTLCKYLGVNFDNIQERTELFKSSFVVKDPRFPKMRMIVDLKHNEQEYEVVFNYADRVGRTRTGRRRNKKFAAWPEDTLAQIETRYDEIKQAFKRGDDWFEDVRKRATLEDTIEDHYEKFLQDRIAQANADKLSRLTIKSQVGRYNNHIKVICLDNEGYEPFRKLKLRNVRRSHIKQLIKKLKVTKAYDEKKGRYYMRGGSVINGIVADIKTFFEWCEDENLVDENTNPVYRIEKEEVEARDRVLTYKQLGHFMRYLMNDFTRTSDRVRVAIYLLWKTGQRVNEVLGLTWDNIVINEVTKQNLLMFKNKKSRKKAKNKGHNIWFLPLDDELIQLFRGLPRLKGNNQIFWTDRARKDGEKYISSAVLNDAIKKCCAELGMETFSPHDIKRSVVTHDMFAYGEDAVKIITGNKDGRVLREHYVHGIKNNQVNDTLYQQSVAIQEQRSADIGAVFEVPVTRGNVLNITPKVQKRNLPKEVLNQRAVRAKAKIKNKFGVSPATYYRRKKEGYYD